MAQKRLAKRDGTGTVFRVLEQPASGAGRTTTGVTILGSGQIEIWVGLKD